MMTRRQFVGQLTMARECPVGAPQPGGYAL